MSRAAALLGLAALVAMAGCSEKVQTNAEGVKHDAVPWSGTGSESGKGTPFTAQGWRVGDKTAWEQQLKTRQQNGQNEFNKLN